VSVGVIDGACMLDLPYSEDSRPRVDMNVVMTGAGRFVEVRARPRVWLSHAGELDQLLELAESASPSCSPPRFAAVAGPAARLA